MAFACCSFFAKLQNKSTQHTNRLYMCREITSNNKSRLLICKMWLGCRANLPLEILTCSLVHKALLVSAGKASVEVEFSDAANL